MFLEAVKPAVIVQRAFDFRAMKTIKMELPKCVSSNWSKAALELMPYHDFYRLAEFEPSFMHALERQPGGNFCLVLAPAP